MARLPVDQQRLAKSVVRQRDELMAESEELPPVDALSECLERVRSELPADDREILRRCDIEGLKQQAFPTAHGLRLPAVKFRLLRAGPCRNVLSRGAVVSPASPGA